MNDRLLPALRRIREIEADELDALARQLLELAVAATSSARATLRYPMVCAGVVAAGSASGRAELELRFPRRGGEGAVVVFEGADDAASAEILADAIVQRLEHARAAADAMRAARQVELLGALTRAGSDVMQVSEVADRAVNEIRVAFSGANVAVHVIVDDHLELIARRLDVTGSDVETAPKWLRRLAIDGTSVQAFASRSRKIVTRMVKDLPDHARAALEPRGVRELVVAPLFSHDVVIGTLTVAHSKERSVHPEGVALLESAAKQLGLALAQVRLLEEERSRVRDLGLINELGSLVAQQLDLSSVLTTVVRQLARVAEVPCVHLLLVDESRTVLTGVACTDDRVADVKIPLAAESAASHAVRTLAPVMIDDAQTDPRARRQIADALGSRSVMAIPLVWKGESIGAIVLVETRHPRKFTKEEIARAVAVANLVAPAITNAKMFEDLRRSYEALAHAQAELVTHERLAALGELSAVIAHEVRNPLAVIFNSLGSLRRLAPPTPDATLLLDIVREEADRLNRIVGDLLDFVRPYSSHPRPANLESLVTGAVEGARRAVREANVEIKTDFGSPSVEVVLDGTMLQQALINLIVNAVQATPKGGSVSVRISTDRVDSGGDLRCEVTDQGPGVADADADRIFQPFFTTKATGTGLGLAVVQRIADALGGAIGVARAPSGGSVFTLKVPLVAER